MHPLMRASLTHGEQKRDDFLEGIDFAKETRINSSLSAMERRRALRPPPKCRFRTVLWVLMRRDRGLPSWGKGNKQLFKCVFVEPRERAQGTRTVLEAIIGEHEAH